MDRALEAGSPLHWAEINTRFHLAISRAGRHADPARHDAARVRLLGSRAPLLLPRRARPSHPARPGRAPRHARPDAGARRFPRSRRPSAITTAARSPPTWRISNRRRCRRSRQDAGASRVSDGRYVRVAALKNAALFRRHLESGGIDLGFDDALVPAGESPFRRAVRRRTGARRQPLLRPADGRLGRHDRRRAERPDAAALAALRRERREARSGAAKPSPSATTAAPTRISC